VTTEYWIILCLAASNLICLAVIVLWHPPRVTALPTFDDYVVKHACPKEQGSTRCYKCGSTSIYVDWQAFGKGINVHSCRHCGTKLYRS
jgi:hypothetical protein